MLYKTLFCILLDSIDHGELASSDSTSASSADPFTTDPCVPQCEPTVEDSASNVSKDLPRPDIQNKPFDSFTLMSAETAQHPELRHDSATWQTVRCSNLDDLFVMKASSECKLYVLFSAI